MENGKTVGAKRLHPQARSRGFKAPRSSGRPKSEGTSTEWLAAATISDCPQPALSAAAKSGHFAIAVKPSRLPRLLPGLALLAVLLAMAAPAVAETVLGRRELAIAAKALPLLRDECFACHRPEKKKGGLLLTSRDSLLQGGSEGPVAVPGKPAESRLLAALEAGAEPHMPPKKQLTAAEVRTFRDWIRAGLPWPDSILSGEGPPPAPVALATLPANYRPASAVALSPDGQWLAAAAGGRLQLLEPARTNPAPPTVVPAHLDAVQAMAWSPDGQRLATAGFRRVSIWQAFPTVRERDWTNGLRGLISSLAFSPDGRLLAVGDGDPGRAGFVRLLAADTGERIASWQAHADSVLSLQFSADGTRLVTAGGDRLVRVWNPATGEEIATLEGHSAQVLAVAFNTNATQVVSGGADRQLRVWDIATREKIVTLGRASEPITSVAWPPDANAILATTADGSLYRYTNLKPHTGEQSSATADERRLTSVPDAILSLSVSDDGKRIAIGRHDGTVQLLDGEGKESETLAPPEPAPEALTPLPAPAPAQARGTAAETDRRRSRRADSSEIRSALRSLTVTGLLAEPPSLVLTSDAPDTRLLLTATTAEGFDIDVTLLCRFRTVGKSPVTVDPSGAITARVPGEGRVRATFGKHSVEVPVSVTANTGAPAPLSFSRDVLPVLARAGCAAGACHAKAEGQNGFKLSVFSYDPNHDYAEIVKDARSRRVFPAAPDESLLLRKALGLMPHEGGRRFEVGSETHGILRRWIREGMAFAQTNEPALERLSLFPRERRYRHGAVQGLRLEAVYSDGSVRDVTRLAAFESNDREIAEVDESGRITVGRITGQGVIVARFMGLVATSQVVVPAETVLPADRFARLPRYNFLDDLAYDQFRRLGLFPSDLCSDVAFLRRASLDTIGVLPTAEEVKSVFAWPANPGEPESAVQARRAGLIDRLMDRPEFADYWANKWADLLRPNPDRVGLKSVLMLDEWLRERFRADQPYDEFVRELLLAEGSNHRDGPAVVYRDRREPPELTTMFSQLFLGTRLECAKCHHHPNEKWSQDDFYQLAACFGPVRQKGAGLSPPISAGRETFYFAPGGTVKHPVTGKVMEPRAPDGPRLTPAAGEDPRAALADWLTATNNPFFARAAVNRVWATFFGRGLVEPVDDFRSSNPCVNGPLLDALAADFAANGYRLKHLIRTILRSRLYQLSSTPNETNLADTKNFSRAYRRRLSAEVLLDAVTDITGVPDSFAATAPGTRAMQTWSYKIGSPFLDAFTRPNPSSDPPCERDRQMSVVQSLHLMNSPNLQGKLSHARGTVRRLAEGTLPPEGIVTELYLATLGRLPDENELLAATGAFAGAEATRQTAAEDVFWALLNSPEFVFNH